MLDAKIDPSGLINQKHQVIVHSKSVKDRKMNPSSLGFYILTFEAVKQKHYSLTL